MVRDAAEGGCKGSGWREGACGAKRRRVSCEDGVVLARGADDGVGKVMVGGRE